MGGVHSSSVSSERARVCVFVFVCVHACMCRNSITRWTFTAWVTLDTRPETTTAVLCTIWSSRVSVRQCGQARLLDR